MNDLHHFIFISPDPCSEAFGVPFFNAIQFVLGVCYYPLKPLDLAYFLPRPTLMFASSRLRLAALKKQKKDEERRD